MRHIIHTAATPEIEMAIDALMPYREVLKAVVDDRNLDVPECALVMPFVPYAADVARARAHLGDIKHLFVVGIGGSSLCTEALYGVAQDTTKVSLTILDTVSLPYMARALHMLDVRGAVLEDIGVVVISKSGSTTETMVNATLLLAHLRERYGDGAEQRVLVVTDKDSALDHEAAAKGYPVFHIPKALGGRFSVFSSVGIMPAALLGLDVESLLEGAQTAITEGLQSDEVLRASANLAARAGGTVLDTFVFSKDLEPYAKWRRQLIAESLGKSPTVGPLPTVSTAADLHSVAQLYLSGPRGIHTDFVLCGSASSLTIPVHTFSSIVPHVGGASTKDVDAALVFGVLAAYAAEQLPYSEYHLDVCSLKELGALMAYHMLEVMFAAEVLLIDAFNQPHVERYKQHMRAKLAETAKGGATA
jgi:glucose-6-phosphate isomerase